LTEDTVINRKPHIVLIVARGEAVRNFLYSDTLTVLSKKARVTLLSVITDRRFIERFQPFAEQIIPLKDYTEHSLVAHFRYMIHNAHFRWIWSEAVKYYWGLHDTRAKSNLQKVKRFAVKAFSIMLANRPTLELLTKIEQWVSWKLRPTSELDYLFQKLQPDLVFNCSHIHGPQADLPAKIAHRLKYQTAGFIFSWDNLTSRSRIFVPYDYYIMWNQQMKDQLLSQYPFLNSDHVFVTGTPQFDFHFKPKFRLNRDELCQKIGIDPKRPYILYTTGMDSDFLEEHRFVEAVIQYLNECDIKPKPQLVVRTYIKGTSPDMQALAKRNIPAVVFPPILWDKKWTMPLYKDLYIYNSLLAHTSLGINAASTVSLELMIYEKPVINIGMEPPETNLPYYSRFSRHVDYEHYRPVVQSGGVMVARSVPELREMIKIGLTEPKRDLMAQKRFLRNMFGGTLDGGSGTRVAEQLIKLAVTH
jgi:hypothetical protein